MKYDPLTGISKKEIGIVKYNLKNEISRKLPELPEPIETSLFIRGRNAWMFEWNLLNEDYPVDLNETISLEVIVKLKKEFHEYLTETIYRYLCKVKMQKDIYHPKISIKKLA